MFTFAFLVGIYSFIIFGIGVSGNLYKNYIAIVTILFFSAILYVLLKSTGLKTIKSDFKKIAKTRLGFFLLLLILAQFIINIVGVFGPEISFDSLWYHLVLPKLFIANNAIYHVPGNLLYYSDFPKLGELLYVPVLMFSNEIAAKFIQFSFGILSCIAIYKISRKYLSQLFALLAVLVFYSNLIVGWQSITAYVDLIRTFFEVMAFWGFLEWLETKKTSWLIESALITGLAVSTKLTGFVSLLIYVLLIILVKYKDGIKEVFGNILIFISLSVFVPLPFFIFSFINTGNPVYPMFSNVIKFNFVQLLSPINLIYESWNLLTHSQDPISPIYIIFVPVIIFYIRRIGRTGKIFLAYSILAFIFVILLPIGDKARFFMPYLGVLSIGIVLILVKIKQDWLKPLMLTVIIVLSLISIGYRFVANYKYVPYLMGRETKSEFLTSHLNFSFGDFYDTDGFFKKNISKDDKVLLIGFHNLYYVDFPFIDSSWLKKGNEFNYIAVQNGQLPERFKFWHIVYSNHKTLVNLYSLGGIKWVY